MHVVEITQEEWRLMRLAVARVEVPTETENLLAMALHKKLAEAASHKKLLLKIDTP